MERLVRYGLGRLVAFLRSFGFSEGGTVVRQEAVRAHETRARISALSGPWLGCTRRGRQSW
ncbi:MAG TPA: hypothetical protein VMT30_01490 [Candidatus Saccharimonadia bacterium]|nr:hypothetical protein [Candidatus Saccharimonadia bacterium]